MCTSLIHNGKKTIVGWNLDILDMEYKVVVEENRVYIAINDRTEGWLPLFGANAKGDFVGMPTCYPHDSRSNPINKESQNIIMLEAANDEFDVFDCFEILKATAQMVCPTVVSMVFDVTNSVVYWCENREWEQVHRTGILIGGYA